MLEAAGSAACGITEPMHRRCRTPCHPAAARHQRGSAGCGRPAQAFRLGIPRRLYPKDLADDTIGHVPPIFMAFRTLSRLRRFIGLGVRPEHMAA
ncbi:hypothetical protein AB0K12_20190 [Nonomuraea sp. NPDC049419]|uniref:hypothetical protein n=1 Tax=Nonomuraea sp. NPDC049419 TaxID=3155772 RepID=UPI00343707EE